ncbi:PPK2 family polyphosphate kinase [Levilactobacillus suantsaiihabitans]|uniref:Polyphosphate kinase 2 family protein n=1 Tax=Levilactobacillus suantsaiihabitans TaxID=2487722 RepID=A0A4Z0JB56_9LACO|nr:PPK2 family polyphosphate kinase [Levilactobacillus suantsaiihabitans]TGD18733.1 polyphosphate kinase 2 family protein [Levilactobacillus suantsaiihabitans]
MNTESRYRYTGEAPVDLSKIATRVDRGPEQAVITNALTANVATLSDLQTRLYAQRETGVIIILQGMDTAGKDGLIRHVFSGLNPSGTSVVSFKQPTHLQLDHDFLWRVNQELPRRGEIRIFNRSQYEDVLISRVHPEMLLGQHLPGVNSLADVGDKFFDRRYHDLRHFETYLRHQGFVTIKFFLHLSREEQTRRFERRIEIASKNWKFSPSDMRERAFWADYQDAYTKMLANTATKKEPWYIIPADDKGVARLLVSNILVKRLQNIHPTYPTVSAEVKEQLKTTLHQLKKGEL